MSTKSREVIWGGQIMGAKMRAESAREAAKKAIREADRAEAEAWSVRMEGYGGPAQPSPTIGQCIHGGLGWLEVECVRCKTRASLPLDAIRRPLDTPIWKLEASLKCRSCRKGRYAPPVHMIKLTAAQEITPYKWVHPDEERYPPGTGFALSIFPAGFQRVPLYALANIMTLLAALTAIWAAKSRPSVYLSGVVGIAALYFMINPAKASFSIAPTMIVCAIVGYLTNALAYAPNRSRRIIAAAMAGLLLGLAVSFRLPNLFLSAGYFVVLLALAVHSRGSDAMRFIAFGAAYILGLAPTLIANAINAGSMFATTYSGADTVPPDFSLSVAADYLRDMQGSLVILTAAWASLAVIYRAHKVAASIVAVNLIVNLAFFLSHPIFTPYYLMPLAMLSLWTLLATTVKQSVVSIPARFPPSAVLSSAVS